MSFLTWRAAMSDEKWVDFGATQDDAEWYARASTTLAWTLGQDPDQEGSNSCTAQISQLFEIPIVAFPMSWPNTRRRFPMRFGTGIAVAPPRRFSITSEVGAGMTGSTLGKRHPITSPC